MSKQSLPAWRASGMSLTVSLTAALGVALLLSLLAWVNLDQAAYAAGDQPLDTLAVITVNTTNPSINDNGLCSIIEAVENANANALIHDDCAAGTGNDTISLPADAVMIFTTTHNLVGGGNALPIITDTMTIAGNGTALIRDATVVPLFRFFNVAPSGNLTLNNLRMHNGRAAEGSTVQLDFGGGAIANQGQLQINNSTFNNNRATFGGAIYSEPITGSLSVNNSTFSANSAVVHGGAVYNFGPGVISDSTLRLNEAAGSGGAILHDSSTLTLTNLTVMDNIVAGTGAGITARALVTDSHLWIETSDIISNAAAINGGGIYNTANNGFTSIVEVVGSSVIANRVTSTATNEGLGGGILNGWAAALNYGVAEMLVSQSSVLDNVAQNGGGIANIDVTGYPTRTAELLISQSTLARNTAAGIGSQRGSGGGLFNSNADATVANSTLSGNQALGDDTVAGGRGGGIGNVGRGITTTLHVVNSTLAFNQATQAGGGIAVLGQATTRPINMEVGNTLIVSNALTVTQSVSNAVVLAALASPQVISGTESCSIENGSSTSLGGNIEDGTTCGLNTLSDSQDTLVVLGALADNGGPTLTHLITKNNPAFDSGVVALCAAAPINNVDQRGVTRPQVARCDIGAVELEPIPDPIREIYFPEIYLHFSFD